MKRALLYALSSGALVVMTVASYAPVFRAEFVSFDDPVYIFTNGHVVTGITAANLRWAFTNFDCSNWHPLTWISHMVDAQMFGARMSDAPWHHAVNLALHAANAVLLFLCFASMTGSPAPSFVVAAFFAIHPVNVESVAWAAQRKTTLSTLFAILSIWTYAGYVRGRSRWSYAASLALFVCSLTSKQTFVILPFSLLLLDYWPLRRGEFDTPAGELPTVWSLARGWTRLALDKIPYLVLSAGAAVLTLKAQQNTMLAVDTYPIQDRLSNVAISYFRYLGIFFWPAQLSVFYPLDETKISLERNLAALIVLLLATYVMFRLGRRGRYFLVGWFWFLGSMLPVIGLVHVGSQSMADRYAYSSFWGLLLILVWAGWELSARAPLRPWPICAAATVVVCLLAACGWRTHVRSEQWHDTITLFTDATKKDPKNGLAHWILCCTYYGLNDFPNARIHSEQAVKYYGDTGAARNMHGMVLCEMGSPQLGIEQFRAAIEFDPDDARAYTGLGWAYAQMKQYEVAEVQFARGATKLHSSMSTEAIFTLYVNWAQVLVKLNRWDEAAQKYDLALQWRHSEGVLLEAAELDLQRNQVDRAIARIRQALSVRPANEKAMFLLAEAYRRRNMLAESAEAYQATIAMNPNNHLAAISLSELFLRLQRPEDAERTLREALDVPRPPDAKGESPVHSVLRAKMGDLHLMRGQVDAAMEQYRLALVDWSDNYRADNSLAWVLATSPDAKRRDPKQATALATKACELTQRQNPSMLGTLAAAYAADGQFPIAVKTAQEALALAKKNNDPSVPQLETQLRLHEQGKPYIDQ